jgi:tetratricopeptide (TPR) repeat protein
MNADKNGYFTQFKPRFYTRSITRQGLKSLANSLSSITRQGLKSLANSLSSITRQGLKSLANSLSPLKRTEFTYLIWGRVVNSTQNTAKFLCLAIAFCLYFSFSSIAATNSNQNPNPNQFPPNPLELRTPDPLLPRTDRRRRLTDAERAALSVALEQLNTAAAAKLQAGDRVGAFEIWYRELRLRRYIGPLSEVQALGRVGAISWQQNSRPDVQIITNRLQIIQQEVQKQPRVELDLLRSLATAYQQVNAPQLAVGVYEQILAVARSQPDATTVEATLLTLAEMNMSYFDYIKAADNYRELLRLAEERSDRVKQIAYLKQLAYIYDQGKQYQMAIKTKQQLIELSLNEQDLIQVGELQLSIGTNYEALGLLEQAAQNYQEAYISAYKREMFNRAAEALQKMANLFQSNNQTQQALSVYQILVSVNALAKDAYGMMNAYDQMGKLFLSLNDLNQAIDAFQKGLEIARQLQYREAYFSQQIEQVNQLAPQ